MKGPVNGFRESKLCKVVKDSLISKSKLTTVVFLVCISPNVASFDTSQLTSLFHNIFVSSVAHTLQESGHFITGGPAIQ